MADKSGSPAFKPPMDNITDNQPFIDRVQMDFVPWANRKSQQPTQHQGATKPLKHIANEH